MTMLTAPLRWRIIPLFFALFSGVFFALVPNDVLYADPGSSTWDDQQMPTNAKSVSPQPLFTVAHLKIFAPDLHARAVVDSVALSYTEGVADTLIAFVQVDRLLALSSAHISYQRIASTESVRQLLEVDTLSASPTGSFACPDIRFDPITLDPTYWLSDAGDVDRPGRCGTGGIELSQGDAGGTVIYRVDLLADPCAVQLTSDVTIKWKSMDDCTLCYEDPKFLIRRVIDGDYDVYRFSSDYGTFYFTASRSTYVYSSGIIYFGFGTYWDGDLCIYKDVASSILLQRCYSEATGTVSASSNPSGAATYLDGVYKGLTPLSFAASAGSHSVRFSKSCYYDCTQSVSVVCNQTVYPYCSLTPQGGTISATSSPTGAAVYLDGVYKGVTPVSFAASLGSHTVRFSKSCYNDCTQSVTIDCTETETAFCTLSPQSGTISASSSPTGANVYLDGSYKGITPTSFTASQGTHSVVISKSCYDDCSRSVTIDCNETEIVSCTLTPQNGTIAASSSPAGARISFITPF